jgi:5-methylcytosine-specific restriction endonuclease McrA
LTEAAAYKRIQAARSARDYPPLFAALAEGQLNLTGIVLLGPHLTPENADELIRAAARRRKSEIEVLIAQRFPRPDVSTWIQALPAAALPIGLLAPGRVEGQTSAQTVPDSHPRVTPLAPERFALQVTIGKDTHDKLRRAQELLSHQVPSGDIATVLDRALDALIEKLEKRKFAATARPRRLRPLEIRNPRHIPAHVKRAVRERDQDQCTFVGDAGHRCGSRKHLQYDHADPVARGGSATVHNIRLRCRAHNQLEAERAFGDGFMHQKREAARRAAEESHARAAAQEQGSDVIAALRELGFRLDQARRAADFSATFVNATLEERVRAALRFLAPKVRVERPIPLSATAAAG